MLKGNNLVFKGLYVITWAIKGLLKVKNIYRIIWQAIALAIITPATV